MKTDLLFIGLSASSVLTAQVNPRILRPTSQRLRHNGIASASGRRFPGLEMFLVNYLGRRRNCENPEFYTQPAW
jgi:hypothetical protein